MRQDSLIVVTRICGTLLGDLREALTEIGQDPGGNRLMPFDRCRTVHFARWVIVGNACQTGEKGPLLVFVTDFDLPLDRHLDELVREGRGGFDRVYGCCEDYPGSGASPAEVAAYLRARRVQAEARYQGARFRSRREIEAEARLRDAIGDFVDHQLGQNGGQADGPALAGAIVEFVRQHSSLREMLAPPPSPSLGRRLGNAAGALWRGIKALPRFVVVLSLVLRLRCEEARVAADWKGPPRNWRDTQAKHLRAEDHILQNQLTLVTEIREGWLWRWSLALVLAWIDVRSRIWDVHGRLGRTWRGGRTSGVQTIHFCQWVTLDERRLLFVSNYDGSFENYLDDFTDFDLPGVTGIWGSSKGCPPTQWFVGLRRGVTSRAIKAFFRTSQLETNVWYSARRGLTMANIEQNRSLREALVSPERAARLTALLGGL